MSPRRESPMTSRQPSLAAALLVAFALAACGNPRANRLGEAECPVYEPDIADLMKACTSCHAGPTPAADYRLDAYFGIVARGPDGSARLVPGDADSPFLAAARGELAPQEQHKALSPEAVATLTDWAVRCRGASEKHAVHPPGWMTVTDLEQFHGKVLRATGYQVEPCKKCHGDDFKGGAAKVDCTQCHKRGPFECNVCHGDSTADPKDLRNVAPPKDLTGATITTSVGVGAHQKHVNDGPMHKAFTCDACHVVPQTPEQPGHYRLLAEDGAVIPKVTRDEVFDAGAGNVRGSPGQLPEWNLETAQCTNAYCHNPTSAVDTKALNVTPTWTKVDKGEAACGTCHGLPPSSHADNRCQLCHHETLLADGGVTPEKHANGTVDLGDGVTFVECAAQPAPAVCQCNRCHGDATSAAPPRDTLGRADAGLLTVGAHRAHVEGPHKLRGPIDCAECHRPIPTVTTPGHLDHLPPAETFPAVTGAGTVARADGALPAYDYTAGTCSKVYCHGNGAKLLTDATPGLNHTPNWLGDETTVRCGGCHGIPPLDAAHPVGTSLVACTKCHAATIGPTGNFKFTTDPVTGALVTTHIDGHVDVNTPPP